MRKGIILAFAGLAILAGCGTPENKTANIPVTPKWKGAPYHISFDKPPAKPNPVGITIPAVKFEANPEMVEKRATLIVRFDSTVISKDRPAINQMIMAPTDISGETGALPADYMEIADKELANLLGAYCVKGKVKVSVAIARSSLSMTAGELEIQKKLLSDWLPIELTFKNPHPKC